MRIFCILLCCLLAGCTSSSRLANPLGIDLDPMLRIIDEQRPVQVVYPSGAPRTSLAETYYGSEWEIRRMGDPPYKYEE